MNKRNLLQEFFNSSSDANAYLEATQQKQLEHDFAEWLDRQVEEKVHLGPAIKPIDKVTTSLLGMTLRAVGMRIPEEILDKVLDVVEMLEDTGEHTPLEAIASLRAAWENTVGHRGIRVIIK